MVALITSAVIAFVIALVGTPVLIAFLRRHRIGQPIHDDVRHHATKAGTPTMGGLVAPVGLLVGFPVALLVSGRPLAVSTVAGVVTILAMGGVGLLDDWMKVRRERNLGLRELQKTVLQTVISLGYALTLATQTDICHQLTLTRCDQVPVRVPTAVWVVAVMLLIWLTTNAVNFTDGVEGLLAGSATVTFVALAGIAYWVFRHNPIYGLPQALEMGIIAACLAGAMCGLLWWNIAPKAIFMGDAGSLTLGAGLVVVCVGLGIPLLIPVIGALYVIEGASSFLQRFWFKWTRRYGEPERLFLMAPIHHHFELKGWTESSVVVRFWVINALAAGVGVALFYGDALTQLP